MKDDILYCHNCGKFSFDQEIIYDTRKMSHGKAPPTYIAPKKVAKLVSCVHCRHAGYMINVPSFIEQFENNIKDSQSRGQLMRQLYELFKTAEIGMANQLASHGDWCGRKL